MLSSPSRCYSDKAVQTEWSTVYEVLSRQQASVDFTGPAISKQAGSDDSKSAYTEWEVSGMTNATSRVNDKSWLKYNHPSCGPRDGWRRVVSLPESYPSGENDGRANENIRSVSMPEPLLRTLATERGVNIPKYHLPNERGYPSDLPQTPSPPSSPGSIVITKNYCQVPSPIFQRDEDESGWIVWANSPPRPIPALHGPSSLPYARCPSGAEGIVVEGDDLAHKVWGLVRGSNSSHARPLFNHCNSANVPAAPMYHSDTVKKHSKPSKAPEACILVHSAFADTTLACSPTTEFSTGCTSEKSHIDLASLSLHMTRYGKQERIGRGESRPRNSTLHRISPRISSPADGRLSSATPAFIPANYSSYCSSIDAYPQQDLDVELSETRLHSNPVSPKDDNELLTPSSTVALTGSHNPWIYSPRTDLDGHWNKFAPQPDSEFLTSQHRLPIASVIYPTKQSYSSSTCTVDRSSFAANLPSVALGPDLDTLSTSNEIGLGLDVLKAKKHITFSPVRRRDLYQQPRSIPLARLIQRRLSSVAEEDATDSRFRLVPNPLANTGSHCSDIPAIPSNTARM